MDAIHKYLLKLICCLDLGVYKIFRKRVYKTETTITISSSNPILKMSDLIWNNSYHYCSKIFWNLNYQYDVTMAVSKSRGSFLKKSTINLADRSAEKSTNLADWCSASRDEKFPPTSMIIFRSSERHSSTISSTVGINSGENFSACIWNEQNCQKNSSKKHQLLLQQIIRPRKRGNFWFSPLKLKIIFTCIVKTLNSHLKPHFLKINYFGTWNNGKKEKVNCRFGLFCFLEILLYLIKLKAICTW